MASEEHIRLADYLKSVHLKLRETCKRIGPEAAWQEHLARPEKLHIYAETMKNLANNHWKKEPNEDRIDWVSKNCYEYFIKSVESLQKYRNKESKIAERDIASEHLCSFPQTIVRLLDVGSCYNPFKKYAHFDPLAIDIAPATDDVFLCDFLNVKISPENVPPNSKEITSLRKSSFHVVVFSLVLEYLPSSSQRIQFCQNAYDLLIPEGLLFVITPDSRHVGANAKLMKTWRYALALMGFSRIKFEKLTNLTCMIFRRAIFPEVTRRWAEEHKEDYMANVIQIPQDFSESLEEAETMTTMQRNDEEVSEMFLELMPIEEDGSSSDLIGKTINL